MPFWHSENPFKPFSERKATVDIPQALETPQKAVSGPANPTPVSPTYGDIPAFAYADQDLAARVEKQLQKFITAGDTETAQTYFAVNVISHVTDAFRTQGFLAIARALNVPGPQQPAIAFWVMQVEEELKDITCTPLDSPIWLAVRGLFMAGKDAELTAEQFVAAKPADADARWVYAVCLDKNKKTEKSLEQQAISLRLKPMATRFIFHALDLNRAKRPREALESARIADVLRPHCPRIKTELAAHFLVNGAFELARRTAECVWENYNDKNAAAKARLIAAATYCNGNVAGIEHLKVATALAPYWHFARLSLGEEQIRVGDWKNGWANYQAIGCMGNESPGIGGAPLPAASTLPPVQPFWAGESLAGKTICVKQWAGYGDQIQFLRFGLKLVACGAKVFWVAPPELSLLFKTFHPSVMIVEKEIDNADYYAWPYQLPHYLGIEPTHVPYQFGNYLAPFETGREHSPLKRVGICWAGNPAFAGDRERSAPLSAFAPLAAAPNTRLYSLQLGPESGQADNVNFTIDGTFLAGAKTFADTAARMENLDLVITVDTAIAHLAGALGKPVWLLLPYKADFRWGVLPAATLWYSSMRLWRQKYYNDWNEVIARAAECLAHWVPLG